VIGEMAMVGAGAVVTHDVPPHSKLAGNPARIIGYVDAMLETSLAKLGEEVRDAMPLGEATVYRLPGAQDLRGSLSFGEVHRQVPFEVKRYFLVFDVASQHVRGEHAHRSLQQFLVCVAGRCNVVTDDGNNRHEVALDSPATALQLLAQLREQVGERVTGFELISRICMDLVFKHIPNTRDPLSAASPWYVLVELSDSTEGRTLDTLLEDALGAAAEGELISDAVIAASDAQRKELWALRENVSEAQKLDGVSIKHDVSVPVSRVPEFIERASAALVAAFPDIRIVAFGHMGDGNVHYNCGKSQADDASRFYGESPDVNHIVYKVVADLNGSISAEHGLGVLKVEEIKQYKSALELDLMRAIKRTLDPEGIMNPGKVL